ncbi:hypothetical protein Tco_1409317 [Tanacetum coccineum]
MLAYQVPGVDNTLVISVTFAERSYAEHFNNTGHYTHQEESDSNIPDPSHQTVTSTPPVIPPFAEISSSMPSLLITPPPINTEATTITTSLPEITPFIALQLRVAKLEQEMSEVKKTDLSADVLASIRSQVPTAVDTYLGSKLDDALLKVLERHTADLIKKYSVLPGPESVKNQESEKSPKEIIKAKKEQDLRLQLVKPGESEASASKKHPSLSSTGWQITDTREAPGVDSPDARSNPIGHSEPILDDISMQDGRNMDECHKLLTNKVDLSNPEGSGILLMGDKERKITLSISSSKPSLPRLWLEEFVPSLWVESEQEYDISAVYGITHWWFRRKEFYINKHSESSDREAVRSQMRILSVISVKVFEKYGYNYLREIILRRADYQEYKISERDFKILHPNDLRSVLLNIQEKLNHLPKQTRSVFIQQVNMWIETGDQESRYFFKRDYTIVPKPRAVVYRDRNDQRKLMRLNELHKFSDGTLTRVMEKLDQMVKGLFIYFEYNKGMEIGEVVRVVQREEAKTSSQQSRKDYRSEGSIEVLKALLEDE